MASAIVTAHTTAPLDAVGNHVRHRVILLVATMSALGFGGVVGSDTASTMVDPDLARLLRYMALLKGVFAAIAFAVCFWRLARPAAPWREVVYVVAPGLMAGGALCLWRLQSAGLAAAGLHIGMFALLAAALTDGAFVPALRRRPA